MSPTALLSRTLDPLLGVFTGVFAFYLHQTNPRTAPPRGETFNELIRWKWQTRKASHTEKAQTEKEPELEAMLASLLEEDSA